MSLNGLYEDKGYIFIGDSIYLNVVLYLLSKLFKLCVWHRILILTQSACLILELMYICGIGFSLPYYVCGVIICGSLIALIYGKGRKEKNCKSDEEFN